VSKADRILGALGEKVGCDPDATLDEIDETIRHQLDRDPSEQIQAKQREMIQEYEQAIAFCWDMGEALRTVDNKDLVRCRHAITDYIRELKRSCQARKQALS